MVKPKSVEKPAEEQQQRSVSSYRGVRKRKWGNAEKAARAFDAAMFCLRGSGAKFNFPSDPPNIAGGGNMTSSQIQIAAARFANSEPRNERSDQPVESLTSDEETASFPVISDTDTSSPLSVVTIQNDTEVATESFPGIFSGFGSGNFVPEFSDFPSFDDFGHDFFVHELPDVTFQNDAELVTGSFPDMFSDFGSGDFVPDFSDFPSFDDFSRDFFLHELPGFNFGEENLDGLIIQDSFLWNF
ncbi:Ethylene-responsive transcription factor ERF017 [Glycine soja]|uniref:Ethylene-responsive transcription factor ERF017 n=1 Tax=Glycine soja TaxID=3848 RepID=A0A0B2PSJ1_GLYSO|nr:Ethylene-responsive transcription factor ERF017 [Glycine soja]